MEKVIANLMPNYSQIWHSLLAILAISSIIDFRWQKHFNVAFHAISGGILLIAPFLLLKPTVIHFLICNFKI